MAGTTRKSRLRQVPLSEVKDNRFDYRLGNNRRFLRRIAKARKSLRAGRGVRLEAVE
jgi:hypothetical protein